MSLRRKNMLPALGFLLLVPIIFQNCSSDKIFASPSANAPQFTQAQGNGQGYDGKLFVSVASQICGDGGAFDAKIQRQDSQQLLLVRDQCSDLEVPVQINNQEVTSHSDGIIYGDRKFIQITDQVNCTTQPRWNCNRQGLKFFYQTSNLVRSALSWDLNPNPLAFESVDCGFYGECSMTISGLVKAGAAESIGFTLWFSGLSPSSANFDLAVPEGDFSLIVSKVTDDGAIVGSLMDLKNECGLIANNGTFTCNLP